MVNCSLCEERIVGPSIQHLCGKKFHKEHLAAWLIYRHSLCLVCHKPFSDEIRTEIKPKSEEEAEKIVQFLDKLPPNLDIKDPLKQKDRTLWYFMPVAIILALLASYISEILSIGILIVLVIYYQYNRLQKIRQRKEKTM